MKRHIVLTGAIALIAMVLGTFAQSNSSVYADASTELWDVKFCAENASAIGNADACAAVDVTGGGGVGYDIVTYLRLDPDEDPALAGSTPDEPFFDLATTAWGSNLNVNNSGANTPAIGSIGGEIDFTLESNAPGSVNPIGGGLDPCGTTPTGVGGNGSIYTGVRAPTGFANMANPTQFDGGSGSDYVQSFDDDDGDLVEYSVGIDADDPGSTGEAFEVAETQEDGIDLNDDGDFTDTVDRAPAGAGPEDLQEEAPNGIIDGAERMPDFLPRLYSAAGIGPVVNTTDAGRGFAVANVLAGISKVDVNFLLLDVTAIGVPGYVSITTIGIVDPNTVYNPATAAQTLQTCTPFRSATTVFGRTRDNPGTGANEAGTLIREVTGDFDYTITVSTIEDYDADGVAGGGIDRCQTDAAAGLDAGDTDQVSGTCDNAPASNDNCDGAGGAPACPRADAPVVSEGTSNGSLCTGTDSAGPGVGYPTDYPWNLDQDVDCDGAANFADNCPTTYNPTQKDQDGDGVGNACDAAFPENACSGDSSAVGAAKYLPCWTRSQGHDHDRQCNDPVSSAVGPVEGAEIDNAPPFGEGVCTASQDSSDDGVMDLCGGCVFPGAAGGHEDINSDSDNDGCPDKDEVDADATCGGNATVPPGDPYNPDVDGDSILDGAEVRSTGPSAGPEVDCAAGEAAPLDDDGDGAVNDGCPTAGGFPESGVNGGCEGQLDEPDEDPGTTGNQDDDAAINDGCPTAGDWRHSVLEEPQTASNVFNNEGSPDSDGDGCSNRRESLLVDGSGGNRDALNPYNFLDVPGPADGGNGTDGKPTLSAGSSRNRAVALTDVGVILGYVGRTSTNSGAAYYNGDLNNDGLADGRQMDRTPGGGAAGNGELAGNLAIALNDVGISLDHVGDNCAGTP